MKTLVIGGTGLISTPVTQQLIERGDEVTVLNRGRTPVRFTGRARFIAGDRTDHARTESLIRSTGPWDCVIDMICSAPEDAESLVRACRGGVGQVIFCSTTNVYPKPADAYPVREDHRLDAAFAGGQRKIRCEAVHREAESRGDFRVTIIRPGHTYGEGGPILHSLGQSPAYLDRVRRGKPIVVHGDGNGLWSALHADDVARVFVAAAGNTAAYSRTYNATGEEWMTWNQYHARVAQAMDVAAPPLVHIPVEVLGKLAPDRAAQTLRSFQYPGIYDMSQARRDLGFRQLLSFTQGMRQTIESLQRQGDIASWETDPEYDTIIAAWRALAAGIGRVDGLDGATTRG